MDLKELKQLRSKMAELRDSDNEGSFLDGIDACLKLIDEEIDNISVKEEIEKLEAKLIDLRSKLPGNRKPPAPTEKQEEKAQTPRRGRPPKTKVEEAENK